MVPPEIRRQAVISFTQLDTYLRCPLRYRFAYIDRIPPDFVPAALAFGSGIHGAVGYFFRQVQKGQAPGLEDLTAYFERYWSLENGQKVIRCPEKESKDSLLTLASRMLEAFHRKQEPETEVAGVEVPFEVPLVDQETGRS
jgi:putative RecB family exonuclease